MLRLSLLSLHNYIQLILYVPLREMGLHIESMEKESETVGSYAFEICRTFAAMEEEFGENLSILLPSFHHLTMAGFSCPPTLRLWLWHKLIHFEEFGHWYVETIKRNLSVVWNMPDLLTKGFKIRELLDGETKVLKADVIGLAAKIVAVNQEENSDEEVRILPKCF